MKTKLVTILLCLSFFSISSIADEPTVGIGTLVLSCDSVSVGDIFNVTLYIDTNNDITTGFTVRRLNWSNSIIEMIPINSQKNCTILGQWVDPVFNDCGVLNNLDNNITYIMVNKLGGVTGNNSAVNFMFKALSYGTLNINITHRIWSGQPGLIVDLMDNTTWHNLSLTIYRHRIYNNNPTANQNNVKISTKNISVNIDDCYNDTFNWSIETSPNIGSANFSNDINGTKVCPVSGLSYDTVYTWYVNATDGKSWTNKTYQFTTEEEDSGSPPSNPPSNPPNDPPDEPDENEAPVPVINISGNQTVNKTLSFNASSSTDDGEITNYSWNFGDNTTAFGIVVTHSYNQSGNYTVTLTITDDDDETATTTVNMSIKNQTSPSDEPPDDDSPDDDDTTPPDDNYDDTLPTPSLQDTDYTLLIIGIIIIVVIVAVGYIIWEWFM